MSYKQLIYHHLILQNPRKQMNGLLLVGTYGISFELVVEIHQQDVYLVLIDIQIPNVVLC